MKQKALLPVAVSEPREKQGYTCGGPLVQYNHFRHTKRASDGHIIPFGERCSFVQEKNGVVYPRKLGTGGDLMTRRTM